MEEFIASECAKIFSKALLRYEKQYDKKAQLLFSLEDGNPVYYLCLDYEAFQQLTIKEILNVKIDLRQYSLLLPPQIQTILSNFSEQYGGQAEVLVALKPPESEDDDVDDVNYFLFVDDECKQQFNIADVIKM